MKMTNMTTFDHYICRVCGYRSSMEFYDEFHCPTSMICTCCGAESGLDDHSLCNIQKHRMLWFDSACQWYHPSEKPDNWNLEEQLKNLSLDKKQIEEFLQIAGANGYDNATDDQSWVKVPYWPRELEDELKKRRVAISLEIEGPELDIKAISTELKIIPSTVLVRKRFPRNIEDLWEYRTSYKKDLELATEDFLGTLEGSIPMLQDIMIKYHAEIKVNIRLTYDKPYETFYIDKRMLNFLSSIHAETSISIAIEEDL